MRQLPRATGPALVAAAAALVAAAIAVVAAATAAAGTAIGSRTKITASPHASRASRAGSCASAQAGHGAGCVPVELGYPLAGLGDRVCRRAVFGAVPSLTPGLGFQPGRAILLAVRPPSR